MAIVAASSTRGASRPYARPRDHFADTIWQRPLQYQDHTCAEGEKTVNEYNCDEHHKNPLSRCAGEDTGVAGHQTICCTCCHKRHTAAAQLAFGRGLAPTIGSQVSLRDKYLLNRMPKLKQFVWGRHTPVSEHTQRQVLGYELLHMVGSNAHTG